MHEGYLSLKDADKKQSNFATELKNFDKGIKTIETSLFDQLRIFFSAGEKCLNNFKATLFPIQNSDEIPTREPTPKVATEPTPDISTEPTEHNKSKLKL